MFGRKANNPIDGRCGTIRPVGAGSHERPAGGPAGRSMAIAFDHMPISSDRISVVSPLR
jgi:hypothetical protein